MIFQYIIYLYSTQTATFPASPWNVLKKCVCLIISKSKIIQKDLRDSPETSISLCLFSYLVLHDDIISQFSLNRIFALEKPAPQGANKAHWGSKDTKRLRGDMPRSLDFPMELAIGLEPTTCSLRIFNILERIFKIL